VLRAQNSIAEVWYTRDAHSYFIGSLYKFCSVMSSSDHFALVRHRAVELETSSSNSQSIQLSMIGWVTGR